MLIETSLNCMQETDMEHYWAKLYVLSLKKNLICIPLYFLLNTHILRFCLYS